MIRKQIDFHSDRNKQKYSTLYQQAFPKNEQTNLNLAYLMILHKGIIYGYYQEESTYWLYHIMYSSVKLYSILYLAVKEEYRNLGYRQL